MIKSYPKWFDQLRSITNDYPELLGKQHIPLLELTIRIMLVTALILLAWMWITLESKYRWRMSVPVALALLALTAHVILRRSGIVAALKFAVMGGWLLATFAGLIAEGVRTPILLVYPTIVIFSGYLLGAHYGIGFFLASSVAIVAMAIGQSVGIIASAPPLAPAIVALAHLIVLAISIGLTLYLLRSFQQSYSRYRLLTENIKDVVWIMDAETLHFRYMSPSIEELSGYTPDECLAVTAVSTLNADAGEYQTNLVRARMKAFLSGTEPSDKFYTDNGTQLRKDGSTIWTEVISSYYCDPESGRVKVRGVTRDVTKRVQAELEIVRLNADLEDRVEQRTAELERANKSLTLAREAAEAANRAKSIFLANMSHELRTPLNAILGFARLLERDQAVSAENRKTLATINRAGQNLLGLINDVLEISRIEGGRGKSRCEPFDLVALLTGVEQMIRVRAEDKGLAFSIEWHDERPARVMGDAKHLRRVLINLLGNAVKYTGHGRVGLDLHGEDEYIRFEVTDTGPGISAEEQERIFQPFYQAANGIAKGEGTGLGLAISREHARLMGGSLTVKSEPGRGSTFILSIPLPASEASSQLHPVPPVIGLETGMENVSAKASLDLSVLPSEVINALRKAADTLDMEAVRQVIAQLRETSPDLAAGLDDLMQGFRFDKISVLCQAAEKVR